MLLVFGKKASKSDSADVLLAIGPIACSLESMIVVVMDIRKMRMAVLETRVDVWMGVRFPFRIAGSMFVLMMHVVNMNMVMRHWLMNMPMTVPFSHVEPDAQSHQDT